MTAIPDRRDPQATDPADVLAEGLQDPRRLPPLADLLNAYPPHVFSPRLYASIELADRMALALAIQAAEQIGLWRCLHEPRSPSGIAGALALAQGFSPALEWLLERLAAAGCLAEAPTADERPFVLAGPAPSADAAAADAAVVREAALRVDPGNAATFDLLEHAAAHYPAVARGEITGQDALLGPGTVDLWLRYFSNGNPLYAVNNWIAATAAVARLRELGERGRELRILEVGAGAGSGSEQLLDLLRQAELLDRVQQIAITEPSAFLLRKAKRALARSDTAGLTFAGLDINLPWDAQGVEAGTIDLVYAVNVLHVARDLSFTLAEAHGCLAPGGWLVAGECLLPDARAALSVEMVFRLLEDPSVITDAALRPRRGFLEWRHWQAAFQAAGFTAVSCEPDHLRIREVYPKLFVAAICGQR